MTEPPTMQWVVYDMQSRVAIAWYFSEAEAIETARLRNKSQVVRPALQRFVPMSRAVLLRISKTT